jgi:hypothetical protein
MKAEMLKGLSNAKADSLLALPAFNIDASWLEIGANMGNIFEGIGSFITGIFD